jgi:hypothetical protein
VDIWLKIKDKLKVKFYNNNEEITSNFDDFVLGGYDALRAYAEELRHDLNEFHDVREVHVDLSLLIQNKKCLTIFIESKDAALKLLETDFYGLKSLVYES